MSHRSSCKCCCSVSDGSCKARGYGSHGSCTWVSSAGVVWLLQNYCGHGGLSEEIRPCSTGVDNSWVVMAASLVCRVITDPVMADVITALRAISVENIILGLLTVAFAWLLFTGNDHFSLELKGKNGDLCLYVVIVETKRSQCPRLWKSQMWTKTSRIRCFRGNAFQFSWFADVCGFTSVNRKLNE